MSDNDETYSESSADSDTKYLRECLKQFNEYDAHIYFCKICHCKVYKGNVISHVQGRNHEDGLAELLDTHNIVYMCSNIYYCNLCYSYTDDVMAHIETNVDHINWRWLRGEVDKNDLKFYVYDQYNDSAEADRYISMYNTMLTRNLITKYNNETFFCQPCQLRLNRTSEIYHMFGNRHKDGLEEYQLKRKI